MAWSPECQRTCFPVPSRFASPVVWDVNVDIRQALKRERAPTTCPPERIYIPTGIRERLLTWAHIAVVAGHPGITHTVQYPSEKSW